MQSNKGINCVTSIVSNEKRYSGEIISREIQWRDTMERYGREI